MHGRPMAPAAGSSSSATGPSLRDRPVVLVALLLSLLVTSIDHTIVNVALPELVRDVGATTAQLQWIVDAYTIVFAGVLLAAGNFGDRTGRRRALTVGLLVFTGGSIVSAVSAGATGVIAGRSVMGLGGAFIMPATLSILVNVFTDARTRAQAIALWTAVASVGVAVGPLVGGWMLASFSWNSVFWINVPLLIAAVAATRHAVPESRDPGAPRPDPIGAVLSVAATGTLVWSVIEAPHAGWASALTLWRLALAATLAAGFVRWELRREEPMLDIRLFRDPGFAAASVAITLAFLAMAGAIFTIVQYLQFGLGYSPLAAGFALLPAAIGLALGSHLAARAVPSIGPRISVVIGVAAAAGGLAVQAAMTSMDSYLPTGLGLMLFGLGLGIAMPAATDSVMASVSTEKAGAGSAVNDTARELGSAIGVAVLGSVLASRYAEMVTRALDRYPALTAESRLALSDNLGAALTAVESLTPGAATLADTVRQAFLAGMRLTLWTATAIAFWGAVVAYVHMPRRATVAALFPGPDLATPETRSEQPNAHRTVAQNRPTGP